MYPEKVNALYWLSIAEEQIIPKHTQTYTYTHAEIITSYDPVDWVSGSSRLDRSGWGLSRMTSFPL